MTSTTSHSALIATLSKITEGGLPIRALNHIQRQESVLGFRSSFELTNSNIETALSLASSINWDDREEVHITRTEVVRNESVVCLIDIDTVRAKDGCWLPVCLETRNWT